MKAILRWTAFMLLTMVADVLFGIVGWVLFGEAGLKYGVRITSGLCFAIVAMTVALYGWHAPLAVFLNEPFSSDKRQEQP